MAQWTPETPWVASDKQTQAVWPKYVCRNPSCKSYGKSHPNCACGAPPSLRSQYKALEYAEGGQVHHCSTWNNHDAACEYFADGGQAEANQEFAQNPELAIDHAINHHGFLQAVNKIGHSRSEDPEMPNQDLLDASRRGRKALHHHTHGVLEKKHDHVQVASNDVEALKAHMNSVRENPSQLLEIGGNLGLLGHRAALAAKSATAQNYLESLRPKQSQPGPLEDPLPVDKMQEQKYTRQCEIVQHPLSILRHISNGTVQPEDITTLQTVYPKLAASIQNKAMESIIDAKTQGSPISYKKRIGLSHLLGQPMDPTMTSQSMQAILAANGPSQGQQNPAAQTKKSGATAATLKQMNKVDSLYASPDEARLINQRK